MRSRPTPRVEKSFLSHLHQTVTIIIDEIMTKTWWLIFWLTVYFSGNYNCVKSLLCRVVVACVSFDVAFCWFFNHDITKLWSIKIRPIVIHPENWHSVYRPTEDREVSWPNKTKPAMCDLRKEPLRKYIHCTQCNRRIAARFVAYSTFMLPLTQNTPGWMEVD